MDIFLAGIMQGSHVDAALHEQDYRTILKRDLGEHLPEARVYDPLADHRASLDYDDAQGREVFFHHLEMCRRTDVLLAFLPQASMGTAIEMWEAWRHGRVVLSISPLTHNWVVRFLSHTTFRDLAEFRRRLASGEIGRTIERLRAELEGGPSS